MGFIDISILFLLVLCAFAAVSMKDLLSVTLVLGAYSLIMAVIWMRLNAVDVAFTEAAVGAGITTVLIIAALSRTTRFERGHPALGAASVKKKGASLHKVLSLTAVVAIACVLIYGTVDMPDFGDPNSPATTHVAKRYVEEAHHETGSLNMVTAVLASYRGYDTFGETTVIFTAGISLILLLRRKRRTKIR